MQQKYKCHTGYKMKEHNFPSPVHHFRLYTCKQNVMLLLTIELTVKHAGSINTCALALLI